MFKGINRTTAFNVLCFGHEIGFQYYQLACMILNACLCHDLMKTLSNPFEVARSRLPTYFFVSFSIPVLLLSIIWLVAVYPGGQRYPSLFYEERFQLEFLGEATRNKMEAIDINHKFGARNLFNLTLSFNLSIYMLLGFYSIIFSCRRLFRPGVSLEMRKLFFQKYSAYVFALIILWQCQLLVNYYELFRPDFAISKPTAITTRVTEYIQNISFFAMFMTGIVISLIRGTDPFFRFLIRQ